MGAKAGDAQPAQGTVCQSRWGRAGCFACTRTGEHSLTKACRMIWFSVGDVHGRRRGRESMVMIGLVIASLVTWTVWLAKAFESHNRSAATAARPRADPVGADTGGGRHIVRQD